MTTISFHSMYWPNTDLRIVESQKAVMKHFNIPINYSVGYYDHGQWMTEVLEKTKSDIICFFDIDCVPINNHGIWTWIDYVKRTRNFCGIAQVANHIPPATHIYAAPAFFVIHKECWENIKVPMVAGSDGKRAGDVCELFCYAAEDKGIPYGLLEPIYYYKEPKEGIWKLADLGCYGIGTIFADSVYHLYQSRFSENVEIFQKHCDLIINDKLDYQYFYEVENERLQDK